MKKILQLLLLMIPLLVTSQNTNTTDIYKGLVNGDYCRQTLLPDCISKANELNAIIQEQSASIVSFSARLEEANNELARLYAERENKAVAIQKSKVKPFGIGVFVGYGIDLKPTAGVGISYNIIRF